MANAYTPQHNFDRELQRPNLELIAKVTMAKQADLNSKRAALQSAYNSVGMTEFVKKEDEEYFLNRYQQSKDILQKYAGQDLTQGGLGSQLMGKLAETVDETVEKAYVSNQHFKADVGSWQKLKSESPDKYYAGNEAYALQKAQAWLNNGQVGSEYNGGGQAFEYDDYNKRILDNIDKIQDALKATYVTDGRGNGYFREEVTGKKVDRGDLDRVLSQVIGQKGLQQMRIEAWYNYDQLPPEQLKQGYDSYINTKIEENQKYLRDYELDLASAKKGSTNYNNILRKRDALQQQQNTLKNQTWEELSKSGDQGRRTAYTNMYIDQVKGNWVDAYAIDEIQSRKVNDFDLKTAEMDLEYQKLAAKMAGGTATSTASQTGTVMTSTGEPMTLGGAIPLTSQDQTSNLTKLQQAALGGMQSARQVFGQGTTVADMTYLGTQLDRGKMAEFNAASVGTQVKFNIGGKEVSIVKNAETVAQISDFYNRFWNESPERKEWRNNSKVFIDKTINTLATTIAADKSKGKNFPTFTKMYAEVEDGQGNKSYELVDVSNGSNPERYYLDLLQKRGSGDASQQLTTAEYYSLNLYTRMHLISDEALSQEVRDEMLMSLRKDVAENTVNAQEALNLLPKTASTELSNPELNFSDVTTGAKRDVSTAAFILTGGRLGTLSLKTFGNRGTATQDRLKTQGIQTGFMIPSQYSYETEGDVFIDTQISDLGWVDTYKGNLSADIDEMNKELVLDAGGFDKLSQGNTQRSVNINKVTAPDAYETFVTKFSHEPGVNPKDIHGSVNFWNKLDDKNNPTGEVYFSFNHTAGMGKNKGTSVYNSEENGVSLTLEQFQEEFGTTFSNTTGINPYSAATAAEIATKVPLGTSLINPNQMQDLRRIALETQNYNVFTQSLLNPVYIESEVMVDSKGNPLQGAYREQIKSIKDDFLNNNFDFNLEPVQNVGYVMRMYRNGQLIEGVQEVVAEGDLNPEVMADFIVNNSMDFYFWKQEAVLNYIDLTKLEIELNNL